MKFHSIDNEACNMGAYKGIHTSVLIILQLIVFADTDAEEWN